MRNPHPIDCSRSGRCSKFHNCPISFQVGGYSFGARNAINGTTNSIRMNINRKEFCRVGVTKPPVGNIPRIVCSLNRTLTMTFWKQKKTDASRTIRKPSTAEIDHEVQSDCTEGINWTSFCLEASPGRAVLENLYRLWQCRLHSVFKSSTSAALAIVPIYSLALALLNLPQKPLTHQNRTAISSCDAQFFIEIKQFKFTLRRPLHFEGNSPCLTIHFGSPGTRVINFLNTIHGIPWL